MQAPKRIGHVFPPTGPGSNTKNAQCMCTRRAALPILPLMATRRKAKPRTAQPTLRRKHRVPTHTATASGRLTAAPGLSVSNTMPMHAGLPAAPPPHPRLHTAQRTSAPDHRTNCVVGPLGAVHRRQRMQASTPTTHAGVPLPQQPNPCGTPRPLRAGMSQPRSFIPCLFFQPCRRAR